MIPDIKELNFPKIDGKQYATLTHATPKLDDMGEKNITTQVKIDGEIVPDFSFDWEVEFQGEKYIMPLRIPAGLKDNETLKSQIDLTFQHWAIYQLKRWPFVTIQQIAAGTYLPDEEVATVQLNLKDFCILFGQVLDYYYGGTITIDLNPAWQYKQEATIITISHTKIWNVLIDAFHDKYGVRWEIKSTAENSNTVKGGERYVIRVGYPTTEVDHIFEYGFEGGLLKVERQVQSEEIRNMLKGRGGETNIPFRYFKNTDPNNPDFRPDPDWVEELANIYFTNLMPATFRSYVQGWKAAHISKYPGYTAVGESNAYAPWAYRKGYTDTKFQPVEFVADEITINPTEQDKQVEILPGYSPYVKKGSSLDKYGPLPDTLDNNDEIYPTLQGTGLDVAVDVERIESDDVAESTESDAQVRSVGAVAITTDIEGNGRVEEATAWSAPFTVEGGMTANLDEGNKTVTIKRISDGWVEKMLAKLDFITGNEVESEYIEIEDVGVRLRNELTGVEQSGSGIPAGQWRYRLVFKLHNLKDYRIRATVACENARITTATLTDDKWRNTFDIWVKNVWNSSKLSTETNEQYAERVWKPVLGDREGQEAKVVFTSGELALSEDYEFTIVDFPVPDTSKAWEEKDENGTVIATHTSHWRIKLAKSDAELEATGKYIPNKQRQGKAGDRFVFIGAEMTHAPYVVDAEIRLDDWKKDQLGEKKEIKPTAVVTTDRVRLNNEGKPDALINQLRVGNSIRLFDKRFFNEEGKAYETLYLQSITYSYREPSSDDAALNPDVEIVLGAEYTTSANPVSMMQGEISALQKQMGSISNIQQIVRAVGDKLYLRKDGISDRSLSPTQFFSLLTSGDFRAGLVGGAGWGFYKDENGNWVLEADRVNVRQEMQVNTLVINQVEGRGGMEIDTAAYIEGVTCVVETTDGYLCYFDQKEGSVANLFHVGDVAYCNRWTAENAQLKFYKRRVTEVGADYVKLTKPLDGASRPAGWTDSGVNGTGIPSEGDNIIHFGSYTDKTRRYVKVRDVVGGGYERYIEELNSVNADGVEYYFVGRQSGMYNGRPRFYIGDDNGYVEWLNGELNIKGRLSLQSSIGDKNIGTYINEAAQSAADAAKAELQKQIDGVIEAFNGMGAPTLSNHPANEWTTDAERKRHDKDVYTDITPYVDNVTTPTSGQSWRWYYNGPTDYGWTKIADSDAVRALQLAHMSVRDTDVLYISHTSQTSAPALPALGADGTINDYKGWQTNAPAWSATKYIWQTTYVRRGDGTASFSAPTCISGRNGTDGASVTVTSTEVRYSTVHDSASQPADSTFTLVDVPALLAGQYLWSRTTVTYSTGQSTKVYAVSRVGGDGASYSANMLLNSMIDGSAHWHFKNASTIDTGRKREGRNSVKISATGLTANNWDGAFQFVDCVAGVDVTGSIWSLVDDFSTVDKGFFMELICYDATGNRISGGSKSVSIRPDQAGEWQQFSASMTTVAGTVRVMFNACVVRNGVAWINSPKLEIGNNPDPVWTPASSEMLGVTIVSKSVTYAKSSGDTQPDDSAFTYQSIGAAAVRPGEYLWTKTEVVYSDGSGTKAYSVSRIGSDGSNGTPGAPGADGRTSYTHYAYADSPDGYSRFSTTYFEGALYVGVCTDYTATDSTDPTKYEWARLRGEDGRGIEKIEEEYYLSDSQTQLTGGEWKSEAEKPTWVAGKFWWTRSKITYTDGSEEYTGAVCATGTPGKDSLILSLSNEMAGVMCDADGNVTGAFPTSQASVYLGGEIVSGAGSGWTFSGVPTGCLATINGATGAITIEGVSADTAKIEVTANKSGFSPLTATMNIYKVKPGEAAVVYSVEPSVKVVSRQLSGGLMPASLKVTKYRTTGSNRREETTEHYAHITQKNAEGSTVSYAMIRKGKSSTTVDVKSTAAVIEIQLRTAGTSTTGDLLDMETVAVITDGGGDMRNLALSSGGWNLPEGDFAMQPVNPLTSDWGFLNGGCATSITSAGQLRLTRDAVTDEDTGEEMDEESNDRDGLVECVSADLIPANTLLTLWVKGKVEGLSGGKFVDWIILDGNTRNEGAAQRFGQVASDGSYDRAMTIVTDKAYSRPLIGHRLAAAGVGASLTIDHVGLYNSTEVPVGWSAAPEDSDYLRKAIVQARRALTEIDGGLILTSLIRLGVFNKAGVGKVMSGISGICDSETSPAIWMGGDMVDRFNNPRGLTPAAGMFRHNGLGYLSNGVIRFLEDAIEIGPPDGSQEKAMRFDQNGMKMFADSDGSTRMVITNKSLDYDAVDAVQGDVTTVPLPIGSIKSTYDLFPPEEGADGSMRLGRCVIHGYGALTSALGTLPANSEISVPVNVNLGYKITTDLLNYTYSGYFRVRIFSRSMVIFDRTANIDPRQGVGSMTVNATTPLSGAYTLEVTIGNTLPGDTGMTATVTGVASGTITKGVANMIQIGANGILIVRGDMKALFCDNYFGVKVGTNFGVQLSPNSITMRLSDSQWRTLSRASDGTLKLN